MESVEHWRAVQYSNKSFKNQNPGPVSMNINVAILGSPKLAAQFGKKGTESDIALYDSRQGDDTASFVHPARYPEKLSSLFFTLELAEAVILEVEEINATLGEMILAIDAAGIKKGYIYLRNYILPDQLEPLVKGTVLENFEFVEESPGELKQRLFSEIQAPESAEGEGTVVPIDHFFPVKGIGTVILGIVRRGAAKRHQKLKLHPTEKVALVRSIQTHDKDVTLAPLGERVGFALKGIEVDDLGRGMVLAEENAGVASGENLVLELELVSFWRKPVEPELLLHVAGLMQMNPCRVKAVGILGEVDGKRLMRLAVEFDRPFCYHPDIPVFVSYLEGGNLRIMGKAKVGE